MCSDIWTYGYAGAIVFMLILFILKLSTSK
jgi:hypothetical protein